MPVDTCSFLRKFTALHFVAFYNAIETETEDLSFVTWLVEDKGADVTCVDAKGHTAAQLARRCGKMRMYEYLQKQEKRQTALKAKEKKQEEEGKKKAAESVTMARRMQEAEEATAALLLELEEEEEAEKQAASKKKQNEGKASGSKKKKKK